jgi:ribosome maturation protein Sdo1
MTTQLVRFKQGKACFEIMVKPGAVKKYREGILDVNSTIETDVIFKDQSKGDRANVAELAYVS